MASVPAAKKGVMGLPGSGCVSLGSHVLTSAAQRHGVAILRSLTQEAGELLSEERHSDRWCESEVVSVFAGVRWCRRER